MRHKRTRRMKPRTAREVALETLIRIDQDKAYSHLALNEVLREAKLDSRDAGLATELVYGTVQRKQTLDYFLARFVKKGLAKLDIWVLQLLRLSFYQLYYLDRIPGHAVVNEAVTIAKKRGHQGISGMVNGVLRSILREQAQLVLPKNLTAVKRIALEHSHPEWLVRRWIKQFGEAETERICAANGKQPIASIRVNKLKHERDAYMTRLQEAGHSAEASPLSLAGIRLTSGGNLAQLSGFEQGDFTIQDESSMLVAESLEAEPGMTVLDACAAPGGKTTHIAELMQDDGHIWANDLHAHKERLISEQVERLELQSIETCVSDALDLPKRFAPETFERILLDAPCSGFGVIRRKPDIKWRKTVDDVTAIAKLQLELLETLSPLLKPGGLLVYSTCTIEREENEAVIDQFLSRSKTFVRAPFPAEWIRERATLIDSAKRADLEAGMLRIHPHDFTTDGFFIARLRKQLS